MDAHDDLAHLFRQVGAARDSYREFALPDFPAAAEANPASGSSASSIEAALEHPPEPPLTHASSASPAVRRPGTAATATALFGLPDIRPEYQPDIRPAR
jgi:hypothetical protein